MSWPRSSGATMTDATPDRTPGSGEACPCDSGSAYGDCCAPVLASGSAATAEAMMRSRYTAYVVGAIDHLLVSASRRQRRHQDAEGAAEWSASAEWLGLEVEDREAGDFDDTTGTVEFRARYRVGKQDAELHEVAQFCREQGEWRYDGGRVLSAPQTTRRGAKIGRNEPCPCGSGRKYKKCCAA